MNQPSSDPSKPEGSKTEQKTPVLFNLNNSKPAGDSQNTQDKTNETLPSAPSLTRQVSTGIPSGDGGIFKSGLFGNNPTKLTGGIFGNRQG